MRVMVTGGTGFVGAHAVKALLDAGHEVRLLVRSPDRVDEVLKPLGAEVTDYVVGDMTDGASVAKAVDGCDAALHSACVVTLERRRADEVLRANPRGAEVVLDAAIERGLDPIVHVSSTSALFRPGVEVIHADLPPAEVHDAYGRSKAEAEVVARDRQARGAPVTIVYPGGVVGPAAGPAMGEMADAIVTQLKLGAMPLRDASWPVVDVRDLAAVFVAVMEPGRGPRRFVCGGRSITMPDQAQIYRELTGRRFPVVPTPPAVLRGTGRMMDALMKVLPVDSVITGEAMTVLTHWPGTDDRRAHEELGVEWRDPLDTFREAIRSLHAAGRISDKQAGAAVLASG